MWTIECYGGMVIITRDDKRHGDRRTVRWWDRCPVATRWISLPSVYRAMKVAQHKAKYVELETNGWTAYGEDAAL